MKPWVIRKWSNGKWILCERRLHGYYLEYQSYNWNDCIEYMNAVESGNARKMYDMIMDQVNLCKGF